MLSSWYPLPYIGCNLHAGKQYFIRPHPLAAQSLQKPAHVRRELILTAGDLTVGRAFWESGVTTRLLVSLYGSCSR